MCDSPNHELLYHVDYNLCNRPSSEFAEKMNTWYSCLYRQLGDYEECSLCPIEDVEPENEDELLSILIKLSYGNFVGAISQYIILKLVEKGRVEADRLLDELEEKIRSAIILGT